MKWIKKGLIYKPSGEFNWMLDRAIAPVCELISDDVLRIYFSVRDLKGRSIPIFLETDPKCPENVKRLHGESIIPLGETGSFDDNGITTSSIVNLSNKRYLYYLGWNPAVNVAYHLAIGLAISENNGPFRKVFPGPILDKSKNDPFFSTAPFVLHTENVWKMWYVSCTGWKLVEGKQEPLYNIKMAVSDDGIDWNRTGKVAIENDEFAEAIGKPFVYLEDGIFKMIYSYRSATSYRTDPAKSYRLGYAESNDGFDWVRKDHLTGIEFSSDGWDSMMMEYASSYVYKGIRYLLYNGNGFGESGFGYAVLG